ncbi:DUF2987 domain-containing protein [Shewanella sp. 202IG2-18]|uniref:DUF2987 domain-containing protein n=1 Tax=Parashewanella hymeniacidonis TaxID=2807618 RepID=UPI0019613BCD|nr:DUF2987 domain-containing protein [Parashewanella hymeniacidonis]MBM7073244.1 DUF2987 domain-containing protein [Parashewanella hymeniacidonis]
MFKKVLLASLFVSFTSSATSISVEYKDFYNRMKSVNKGSYSLVKMGFYLPQTDDCKINSGSITTERKKYPLSFSSHQELFLPYNEKLKSDRALINLDLAGDPKKCGIQIQVNATSIKTQYKQKQLDNIYSEMNALMSSMQGFPLKYFSDDIDGLTFTFASPSEIKVDGEYKGTKSTFELSKAEMGTLKQLSFSKKPLKISPWIGAK